MKTLKKIQINPARLMKNDELISLKGGYDGPCCWCIGPGYYGAMAAMDENDCRISCANINSIYDWKC